MLRRFCTGVSSVKRSCLSSMLSEDREGDCVILVSSTRHCVATWLRRKGGPGRHQEGKLPKEIKSRPLAPRPRCNYKKRSDLAETEVQNLLVID